MLTLTLASGEEVYLVLSDNGEALFFYSPPMGEKEKEVLALVEGQIQEATQILHWWQTWKTTFLQQKEALERGEKEC